tara:strand:+ start:563 stop:766 length:204 start_codon:yes stop_codon:yes gene_type:complete
MKDKKYLLEKLLLNPKELSWIKDMIHLYIYYVHDLKNKKEDTESFIPLLELEDKINTLIEYSKELNK